MANWQRRVRFITSTVLVFFLGGWTAWFFPFDDLLDRSGTPLGADYVMLYMAGRSVVEGVNAGLYDEAEQLRHVAETFPGLDIQTFRLPYRYPPLVAIAMVPLACLPYGMSFSLFTLASLAAFVYAMRQLLDWSGLSLRDAPAESSDCLVIVLRRIAWTAAIGWPVFWEVLLGGQLSMIGLAIFAACLGHLHRGNQVAAGAFLGLAAYKPNLLLLAGLGIVLRYPRAIVGVIGTGLILLGLQWAVVGEEGLRQYLELSQQLALKPWDLETPFWKVHGLSNCLAILVPGYERKAVLLIGLLATLIIVWAWRGTVDRSRDTSAVSMLLLVNALCNPYLPIYDLIFCLVPASAYLGGLARQPTPSVARFTPLAFATVYLGPHLSQAVSLITGYQVFPLALLAIAFAWALALLRRPAAVAT